MKNIRRTIFHSIQNVYYFVLAATCYTYAQNRFVESINGTYDFDNDGLSEFLAINREAEDDKYASILSYFEINDFGEHRLLWHYRIPPDSKSTIIDAKVSDTNGDGLPEIIVALKATFSYDQLNEIKTLLMFEWIGETFTSEPVFHWNHLGTSSIAVYNAIGDEQDEIAVALGSPTRSIALLKVDRTDAIPKFMVKTTLTSKSLHSGYGRIYVTATDYNQDNLIDLVAVSPEISRTIVQVFKNLGSEFAEGPVYDVSLDEISPGTYLVSAAGITVVDVNQNGISDILLPFESGELAAIEISEESAEALQLDEDLAPLFRFPKEGYSPTAINEILLQRAEMGITGKKIRSLKLKELSVEKDISKDVSEQPEIESFSSEVIEKQSVENDIPVGTTSDPGKSQLQQIRPIDIQKSGDTAGLDIASITEQQPPGTSLSGQPENADDAVQRLQLISVDSEPSEENQPVQQEIVTKIQLTPAGEIGSEPDISVDQSGEPSVKPEVSDNGKMELLRMTSIEVESGKEPISLETTSPESSSDILIENSESSVQESYNETADAEAMTNKMQQLQLTSLGDAVTETEEATSNNDKTTDILISEEISEPEKSTSALPDKKIQKIQLTTVTSSKEIVIPPGVQVSDTVFYGDTFTIPLTTESGGEFHSFKWLAEAPFGSRFDPGNLSITWTPLSSQIGLHKFAYTVQYKTGEKFVEGQLTDEGIAEDKILPIIKTSSSEMYIVVLGSGKR